MNRNDKSWFLITFSVSLFLCFSVSVCFAQQTAQRTVSSSSVTAPKRIQPAVKAEEEGLVDTRMSQAITRIDDLERRVTALEREKRFLDERIRMMDRTIDDLRRRR